MSKWKEMADVEEKAQEGAGVYVISMNGVVLYIGSSRCLIMRLYGSSGHMTTCQIGVYGKNTHRWGFGFGTYTSQNRHKISIRVRPTYDMQEALEIEKKFITRIRPLSNKCHNPDWQQVWVYTGKKGDVL